MNENDLISGSLWIFCLPQRLKFNKIIHYPEISAAKNQPWTACGHSQTAYFD